MQDNQEQKNQELMLTSNESWTKNWATLSVKANQHPAEILRLNTPAISTLNLTLEMQEVVALTDQFAAKSNELSRLRYTVEGKEGILAMEKIHQEMVEMNALIMKKKNAIQYDSKPAELMLQAVIVMLLDFYGVEWAGEQIEDTAEMIYSEYSWLHMAELKQFLIQAKTGHYGTIWGGNHKFAPPTLLEWLNQYADQSMNERKSQFAAKAMLDSFDSRWSSDGIYGKDVAQRKLDIQLANDKTEQREKVIQEMRDKFKNEERG